jgi:hypothetical protein
MKKLLLPLAIALLLALAVPAAFADAELGIGVTPTGGSSGAGDALTSFHVGYSWTILYFSWDAYAMPDYWVYNATTYVDPNSGYTVNGYNVPGFMNLFDVGLKLTLQPFVAYAEVGVNYLYLRGGQTYPNVGVNARLGAGLRFGWWGVDVSGTQVFASWSDLTAAFAAAANSNTAPLLEGLLPTINFTIYF